jgi:hypothetical protein
MRTLAIIGAGAIAALMTVSGAFAWTVEQPAKGGSAAGTAVDLSDNDAFQALQDKVNGKTPSSMGSFKVYGGVSSGAVSGLTSGNPYGIPSLGGPSAFSYSPNPGFRGTGN